MGLELALVSDTTSSFSPSPSHLSPPSQFTAGLELALASDIVVATKGTRFAQLEVTRGGMDGEGNGGDGGGEGRGVMAIESIQGTLGEDGGDAVKDEGDGWWRGVVVVGWMVVHCLVWCDIVSCSAVVLCAVV